MSLTPRCSRADPFGASGQESLDMLIHILVLLGFIAMALLTAAGKGFSHWHGEAVDALH